MAGAEERQHTDAMRVLLEGISGLNASAVARETGLTHLTVLKFQRRHGSMLAASVEALEWFIWRRLNRVVLLTDEENGRGRGKQHYAKLDTAEAVVS